MVWLWQAANTDAEDDVIDKSEYVEMHRRVVLSLQPMVKPAVAVEAAEEDWVRDSEGKSGLDRARFYTCWFELADLWTDDIDRDQYVEFLESQREMITQRLSDGRVVWKHETDVMLGHFEQRRKMRLPAYKNTNLPTCLSTWHRWFLEKVRATTPPRTPPPRTPPPRTPPPLHDATAARRHR